MKKHFKAADKDKSGSVCLQEFMDVASQLNIELSEDEILACFKVRLNNMYPSIFFLVYSRYVLCIYFLILAYYFLHIFVERPWSGEPAVPCQERKGSISLSSGVVPSIMEGATT